MHGAPVEFPKHARGVDRAALGGLRLSRRCAVDERPAAQTHARLRHGVALPVSDGAGHALSALGQDARCAGWRAGAIRCAATIGRGSSTPRRTSSACSIRASPASELAVPCTSCRSASSSIRSARSPRDTAARLAFARRHRGRARPRATRRHGRAGEHDRQATLARARRRYFISCRRDAGAPLTRSARISRAARASCAPDVLHVHGLGFAREVLDSASLRRARRSCCRTMPIALPRFWRRGAWRRGAGAARRHVVLRARRRPSRFAAPDLLPPNAEVFEIPESTSSFTPGDAAAARAADRDARRSGGAVGRPPRRATRIH